MTFRLYVAGASPRSGRAIENLRRLIDEHLGACEVEVIDVLEHPERAEAERILATPTLLRETPLPRYRITGDLSDPDRILGVLGFTGSPSAEAP